MKIVAFEDLAPRARDEDEQRRRTGSRDHGESEGRRTLAETAPDGLRFHLGRGIHKEGKASFKAPRHHHAFQQVRWCDTGRKNFAPDQFIEAGDVVYFPKGAYYGPEDKTGAYTGWSTQFGFGDQHQLGSDWEPFRREARHNLAANGVMAEGRYTPNGGVEMDGVEAVYAETVRLRSEGREKYVIPLEGYDAPIVMHPAAFAFYEIAPGVEVKRLGNFFDHPNENGDTRISIIRLAQGGVYKLKADRNQIGMATTAGLQVNSDNRVYQAQASYYSPLGETMELRGGQDGTEVYVVELPRQD
jgi:hypothetical protein